MSKNQGGSFIYVFEHQYDMTKNKTNVEMLSFAKSDISNLEHRTKEQYQKLPEMSENDHYNHNHFLIKSPPNYDWGQQLLWVNYVSRPVGEHDKFLSGAEIKKVAERITKTLRGNHYFGQSCLVAHQNVCDIYNIFHSYLVDGGIIQIAGEGSRYTPTNSLIINYENIGVLHTTEEGLARLIREVIKLEREVA